MNASWYGTYQKVASFIGFMLWSFVITPSKQTNKASPSATDISTRCLTDREHVSDPKDDFVLGRKFNVTE